MLKIVSVQALKIKFLLLVAANQTQKQLNLIIQTLHTYTAEHDKSDGEVWLFRSAHAENSRKLELPWSFNLAATKVT